jgi:hypothetical protein
MKMTPERLKRNLTFLDLLVKAKKPQRSALINTASNDQLQCICDCAVNILNENIPLTDSQYRKLSRVQKHIRYIANSKDQLDNKKVVIQKGGFLPILLTPILSAAASLLTETLLNQK